MCLLFFLFLGTGRVLSYVDFRRVELRLAECLEGRKKIGKCGLGCCFFIRMFIVNAYVDVYGSIIYNNLESEIDEVLIYVGTNR